MNTPKFRVSFPNVFEAKKNDMNGKDEFSVMALYPKGADMALLEAEAEKAVIAKWGADKSKWPAKLRSPFRDQGEKAKRNNDGDMILPPAHEEGAIFMNLKSQQKPHVVDNSVQDIIDRSQFYAGCWAVASVSAYAYDAKGNCGVAFGLGNIQKVGEGEPLGGRTRPEDDFAPVDMGGEKSTAETGAAGSIFN